MSLPASFDVLVVGGGAAGLATAWHLARTEGIRVGLVERFRFGHDRGSSHGYSRITRSAYADPLYVELMQLAHGEEWPRLERDAGEPLIHRSMALIHGPAGSGIEEHAAAVASVGADVEQLEPAEARRRHPLFRFPDAASVLEDHTAGVIAADRVIAALARLGSIHGVHALEDTRVEAIEPGTDRVTVRTDRGTLHARRCVVTAGAWVRELVPALAARLTVRRQTVGYFRLDAPADAVGPGHFPPWIALGAGANDSRYGLPQFGREGIKAAFHEVAGESQDPDGRPGPDPDLLHRVRSFVAAQFAAPLLETVHAETCLYTSTDDEDFVIGPLPGAPNVIVGSACSGHGFKFTPLTGRLLAELALTDRTGVPAFERARARFAP